MPIYPAMTISCSLTTSRMIPPDYIVLRTTGFSLPIAWAALVISTPLWILIYVYLDAVMPNTYGVRRHPLFCCRKSDKNKRFTEFAGHQDSEANRAKVYNERDPILFNGLTKKFGDFTAVNKLTLSIQEGEIFTLLGHNGAGKTTAIYMLTGVLEASSGDAIVYGNSIRDSIDKV